MSIAAGVILSIALQQVDAAPDTQGTAQTDHDRLQSIDCAVEKFHKVLTFCRLFCGTQKFFSKNTALFGGYTFVRQVDFVQVKTFILRDYLLPLPAQGG